MRYLVFALALLGALIIAAALTIQTGAINVAADQPHWPPVAQLLSWARERSIAVRASRIEVPDLEDAALIREGAGNYAAMCVDCHRAPGLPDSELSRGLSPAPPALAVHGIDDPAAAFWVIKHGIQATGMPAWGQSMDDRYIWGMVAFLRKLPDLQPQAYQTLVAQSGGHVHGEGEHPMHATGDDEPRRAQAREPDAPATAAPHAGADAATDNHHKADGHTHRH